ncbi:4-(cytidine 5'-diphospho)-2-C-methyl-D-erythritol kinase [Aeromicrobium phragmitis]|uniref:4-diphosphocytidyl-2-C-methyl-D-erythritol kinase n=1 Tax=Aeromicrobium phragmitis TaxID=2478914 RepID=A0A3L8PPE2_9ACTN|nr:4-(cytidine 5'-diphospho)-2-C-methyl-D-erythritol kinase [Aeromicrobium phragmitis]RLV56573.1 4-(cytidine 5'-diphospho)-2-C-methyl-D-erythritol kinase [Aeromicrobium phragmitis]
MRSVKVRVPAKINLALHVGAARADGYHQLATVFHAIDIHDEITATASHDGAVNVEVVDILGKPMPHVPSDRTNLAAQAALLLRDRLAEPDLGVHLRIRKAIPVAGGMAGGSADAAGALLACNDVWRGGLTRRELDTLAAVLGSDVPFLLHGGNALGTGRGEQVTPVLSRSTFHWVLGVYAEGMSTPAVYAEFDRLSEGRGKNTPDEPHGVLAALGSGDPEALAGAMRNDLTDAALSLRPELARGLDVGSARPPLTGLLSGSGPTTVFLMPDSESAEVFSVDLRDQGIFDGVVVAEGPAAGARVVG